MEKFAIVIGINSYRDPAIPALKYARNDAIALHDFLVHPSMGGFKRENVRLLVDEEATVGDVRSLFAYWLGANASENDHVWIFFSGYGATEVYAPTDNGPSATNFLLAHDSIKNDLPTSAIPIDLLDQWLELLVAEHVMLFLDCGFSSSGQGRTLISDAAPASTNEAFLRGLSAKKNYVIFAAAGPGEVAAEDEYVGHGIFTRFLLQKFHESCSAHNGSILTLDDLYQYLATEVPQHAELSGVAQNPFMIGNLSGDFDLLAMAPAPAMALHGQASEEPLRNKIEILMRQAQHEVNARNFLRARDLLQEILVIDAGHQRARHGLERVSAEIKRHETKTKVEDLFREARKHFDDKDYAAALKCYRHIEELEPGSESARQGAASCEALLQKQSTGEADQSQHKAGHAGVSHRLAPYEYFIWPYIGWWSLLGFIWGIFGARHDPETSILLPVATYLGMGILAGLVHGTVAYFFKRIAVRMRVHRKG